MSDLLADSLPGTPGNDTINGGARNDTFGGSLGNDRLDGGADIDLLDYGAATAAVTVDLTTGRSTGAFDNDTLSGFERVTTGTGADSLVGATGVETMIAGGGNDSVGGSAGNDRLDGGSGINLLDYGAATGAVTINLATNAATGAFGTDVIVQFQQVITGASADSLLGGGNSETLDGGGGNDTINGGGSTDAASYLTQTAGVTVNLGANSASGSGAGTDSLVGIEQVYGGSGNDSLVGATAAETFFGGGGDDSFSGSFTNDSLIGGLGADFLDYGTTTTALTVDLTAGTSRGVVINDRFIEFERVTTGSGADSLVGVSGSDTLVAGGGDDTFSGTLGNDSLVGGDGTDVLNYGAATSAITVNLPFSSGTGGIVGAFGTDNVSGFEQVITGSGADILNGGGNNLNVSLGAGNDVLNTSSRFNDSFDGGDGIDELSISSGRAAVTVDLSTGRSTSTSDNTFEATGNDTFIGFERVTTAAGNDSLVGFAGADTLFGGDGDNTYAGTLGDDLLGNGGSGFNVLDYGSATSAVTVIFTGVGGSVTGAFGNDTTLSISRFITGSGADSVAGEVFTDNLAETIATGAGDDSVRGTRLNDSLVGGADTDLLNFGNAAASVTVDLSTGRSTGAFDNDTIAEFEQVTTGTGADSLVGATAAETMAAGAGNDSVSGTLGDDSLDGGANTDLLAFGSATTAVTVDLAAGTSTGAFGNDSLAAFEQVTSGTGADSLLGTTGAETFDGGGGDDTILGGAGEDAASYLTQTAAVTVDLGAGSASGVGSGSDSLAGIEQAFTGSGDDSLAGTTSAETLVAGGGNDSVGGGFGSDSLAGGTGTDLLDYGTATTAVTVDLTTGRGTSALGNDTVSGFEQVTTGAGADSLAGATSAETLVAGGGNDSAAGTLGDDSLVGGADTDLLDYAAATTAVTVDLTTGRGTGAFGADSLAGFEQVRTGAGADSLIGAGGAETLDAGAGNDTLLGGRGDDLIAAGASADEILWAPGQGADTIDGGADADALRIATPDFTPDSLPTLGSGPAVGLNGWERISGVTYDSPEGASYRYIPTGETIFVRNVETLVICFYPGTRIATPEGERAVETLAIGDLVLTSEGKAQPVRWMGRQTVSTVFGDPLRVLPVRITADALADGVPARDLLLSPDHAVLVEGVLVQAGALVNGTTILRAFDVPEVFTYHHIELAAHDLILAEGTPAETFVDNAGRLAFDNWAEHEACYGGEAPIAEMDRPRAKAQRQLPRFVGRILAARAGMRETG